MKAKLALYATNEISPSAQRVIAGIIVTFTVLSYLMHYMVSTGVVQSNLYWLSNNAIGYTLLIKLISSIQIGKVHLVLLLYAFMVLYDCFFVFGSEVMVTVATRIDNPMKFIIPDNILSNMFLALYSNVSYSMLGYGDIFIPSLILSIALRIDFIETFQTVKAELTSTSDTQLPRTQPVVASLMELRERVEVKFKSSSGRTLYKGAMLGYIIGLCFSVAFLYVFRIPVPALLFILPT